MSEYINENADIFDDESKKQNIVIRVLKWVCGAIILLICAILFYRCVSSADHAITDKVLMNDAFYEAYEENPEELKVEKYGMQSPWVSIREGRLVEFNQLYYIPILQQMQFSIKYNEDLTNGEYTDIPFKLVLIDEMGNEYSEYWYETAQKERYKYIRVCFENINVYADSVDENGQELRHTYKLKMEMIDEKGQYNYLCTYNLYDGKTVCRDVKYTVKK